MLPALRTGRKFVDYRMESAPTWDGEMLETKYRAFAFGWWRQWKGFLEA